MTLDKEALYMITTKTPFRISFFGGGTDYPDWVRENGGAVLSTSINKYCYITSRYLPRFFDYTHRIVWSKMELCKAINEIGHPAIREGLKYLGFDDDFGMEIHHQGDLPARSGIGSSSSFVVGLLKNLYGHKGKITNAHDLAKEAIYFEKSVLGEQVGYQDQIAAAYGGMNLIKFRTDSTFSVEPVLLNMDYLKELESRLILFFTGTSRTSSVIAEDIVSNIPQKKANLKRMQQMTYEATNLLAKEEDLSFFGHMLHEGWTLKKSLSSQITNTVIDEAYDIAIENGAIGGKLLGAGASGFMLFYVPESYQKQVKEALGLLHVPFKFGVGGSQIIYHAPEEHVREEEPTVEGACL